MSEDQKSGTEYGLREDLQPLVGSQVVAHVAQHQAAVEDAKRAHEQTAEEARRRQKWQELSERVSH